MARENAWAKVDFTFEPEDRTNIGMVGGTFLKMGDVSPDGRAQLLDENGYVVGYTPMIVMQKVEGHDAVSMQVNDDCRTVSVNIMTAGKAAQGAVDAGWGCWSGCFMSILLLIFIVFIISLIL